MSIEGDNEMFTAYFYNSLNIEEVCNRFLQENFEETSIQDILKSLNPVEFVEEYLLSKEYLDGEILEEDGHTIILIRKFIDNFNPEDFNLNTDFISV